LQAGVAEVDLRNSGAPESDVREGGADLVETLKDGQSGAAYLCTGVVGYDGPTGLGTPNGVGAF